MTILSPTATTLVMPAVWLAACTWMGLWGSRPMHMTMATSSARPRFRICFINTILLFCSLPFFLGCLQSRSRSANQIQAAISQDFCAQDGKASLLSLSRKCIGDPGWTCRAKLCNFAIPYKKAYHIFQQIATKTRPKNSKLFAPEQTDALVIPGRLCYTIE